MKQFVRLAGIALLVLITGCAAQHGGGSGSTGGSSSAAPSWSGNGVKIVKPATFSSHKPGPVEICMETSGYTVEPAKNGVNEGKGHHHLIIDVDLPDLGSAVPKDSNHVHMGDGSKCKTLDFGPGNHTITALFAKVITCLTTLRLKTRS